MFDQTIQNSTGDLQRPELRSFKDWFNGLSLIKNAILKNPVLTCIAVVLFIIEEIADKAHHKIPLISLVELFVMVQMSYPIMLSALLSLNSSITNLPQNIDKRISGRLLGVAFLYNLITVLLSLLLLLPGIWWGTRSSLAAVCACLENKNPIDCFKSSHRLVSGNFWLTFSYLVLCPSLILIAIFFLLALLLTFLFLVLPQLAQLLTADNPDSPAKIIIASIPGIISDIIAYVWILSLFPLMVKLHQHLLAKKNLPL